MTPAGLKTHARSFAAILALHWGCGAPAANKPVSEKVVSPPVESSAQPVQSTAVPALSAPPPEPEAASSTPKVVDLGPPDKDSCPGYLAEARKHWPVPDRLKYCIPEDGGGSPLTAECEDAARIVLERRVTTGKPTIDELRMLKAICKHERDAKCASCVSWMINDAIAKSPQTPQR